MAIRLEHIKAGQNAEKLHVGRNFVYSVERRKAFEAHLSAEQKRRIIPLGNKLAKKASAYTKTIVAELKRKLQLREITVKECGEMQIAMLDEFIVKGLPIPKGKKETALKAMRYEALISGQLANALLKEPTTRAEALSMLENELFVLENLSPPYRAVIEREIDVNALNQAVTQLRLNPNNKVLLPKELVIAAKIINTACVREILGEEMSDIYALAYGKAKYALDAEVKKAYGYK